MNKIKKNNIENYVFDLGNVVFTFKYDEVIKHFNNGLPNEKVKEVLFGNWTKRDSGELSDSKLRKILKKNLNQNDHELALRILNNWIDSLNYNEEVLDVIKQLKDNGKKVFVISNIPLDFAKRFKKLEQFKNVDKAIFSSKVKLMKPDKRIFYKAIKKFKINPKNTIYIDDSSENVISAKECGFAAEIYKNNIKTIVKKTSKNE